ncbi:hypothetical protein NHX12_014097 [Muraenolepis orangiensis]|uniref:Uncharacterized protein n=1 Tax=Muraenolepis orangiensis TaxID=630683 RepID=A0A9Q0DCY4_9TELE|nr:hypothetical protein NHX12_014097 [Muraenolepis orangiensis]
MDILPILVIMAQLLLPCMSERQNFPVSKPATWVKAREHCKVCYKDLVTVSYDNILTLVRGVTRQHWIGLREKLDADAWSGWANGDPLIFQNWFPSKRQGVAGNTTAVTVIPEACTGDSGQTTNYGTPEASTGDSGQTTNYGTPEASTGDSGQTTNYGTPETSTPCGEVSVKEACVAMLSSGPWVEMDCSEELPYICYEDRFFGNASVNMTATGATLRWTAPPGNISSYRVEVREGVNLTDSAIGLTYDLFNMTPGTLYTVQVFAEKCDRDLNPQNISFFTKPETPLNLTASYVTESSVLLSWDRPAGNLHFYQVVVRGGWSIRTLDVQARVAGLVPGGSYTLDVFSAVDDGAVCSDPASLPVFTQPSCVSDISVTEVNNHSLLLSWTHSGNATGYRVVAKDINQLEGTRERGDQGERGPGRKGTRERGDLGERGPGRKGTRERGDQGERGPGRKGTRERGDLGERGPGREGTREGGDLVERGPGREGTWESGDLGERGPGRVGTRERGDQGERGPGREGTREKGDQGERGPGRKGTSVLFQEDVGHTDRSVRVTGMPAGTRLWLTVWSLAGGGLEGDEGTVDSFLDPNPVPSLNLSSTVSSVTASWPPPAGSYEWFHVSILLEPSGLASAPTPTPTNATSLTLDGLYTASRYKVTVTTTAGDFTSAPVVDFIYTKPVTPTIIDISFKDKRATLKWMALNSGETTTEYLVTYNASFWNHSGEALLTNTSLSVGDLRLGTYYKFWVYTVSGDLRSLPAATTLLTEGEQRHITLSMLCSSVQALHCDASASKATISTKV